MKAVRIIAKILFVLWMVAVTGFLIKQAFYNRYLINQMQEIIDQVNFLTQINTPAR